MKNSNDDAFRERSEGEPEGGLKYQPLRPEAGIKVDGKLDLPALDLGHFVPSAMSTKDIAGKLTNLPSANTLQVDSGKLDQLDRSIHDILKQQQNKQLRAYLEEAQRFIDRKQYREALGPLEKALGIDATSASTLFLKGYCFFGLKEYEKAIDLLHQARAHMGPQDVGTLLLILMLEAACTNAITQAVKKKIEGFLAQEQYIQALTFVDSELAKRPTDPVLLYDRCGILMLLKRFADARKVATNAIPRVGPGDAAHFQELLELINEQEASQRMEIVRDALRKGNLNAATRELENCRAALAGQEYYNAVCRYVEERRNPRQEKQSRGLFGIFGSGKPRQKDSLQGVLMWLLTDELAEGMVALKQENFIDALRAFAAADKIDARCGLVAYLYSLAAYRQLEHMMEHSNKAEDIDLERAKKLLDMAAYKLPQAVGDPLIAKPAHNLQEVVQRNSAEVSVALCIQNFKTMMDYYQEHPIGRYDYHAKSEAQSQVARQLLAVAEAQSKQPRGSQHVHLLNLLEKRLKTLEKQLK